MDRAMRCRGGDFDPDGRAVDATNANQVIGDAAVAIEQLDEILARLRIDEARGLEGLHQRFDRIGRIAEDGLEMRIGRESTRAIGTERANVNALFNACE